MVVDSGQRTDAIGVSTIERRGSTLKILALTVAVLLLLAIFEAVYYKRAWHRLDDRDSMDIAQIARNLVEGRGYTTRFVRPFNACLLPPSVGDIQEVNHPPLAPLATAFIFKIKAPSDESASQISLLFTFLTVSATCVLGWILFDWKVGLLSASALGLSAGVLDTGISANEWPMATLWYVILLIMLARHHSSILADKKIKSAIYAGLSGVFLALLYLTNHILAALIIPVAMCFAFTRPRRKVDIVVFLVVVVVISLPWAYRNIKLTGFPIIGISAWDMVAHTDVFPGDTLYRSTLPAHRDPLTVILFPIEHFVAWMRKLTSRSTDMISAMASIFGLVVLAFAVVSMLYRFKKPTANAVRGVVYATAPIAIICFALFSIERDAVMILAPVVSIFGTAYFILLLKAKQLHPFFHKMLIVGFVVAASYQAVFTIMWPPAAFKVPGEQAAYEYFQRLGTRGFQAQMFTDKPWEAAWRTLGTGVWLPMTDSDVAALQAKGFQMEGIVLTHESDNYSPDELWYNLHRVRAWQEYIRDPKAGLAEVLKIARVDPRDAQKVEKYMQRLKRQFAISQSLRGFIIQPRDPLAPDDLQVFLEHE
jgi:hypothetical protein